MLLLNLATHNDEIAIFFLEPMQALNSNFGWIRLNVGAKQLFERTDMETELTKKMNLRFVAPFHN